MSDARRWSRSPLSVRARPTAQPCRIGEPRPDPGARRARDRGRRWPRGGRRRGHRHRIAFDFFLTVPYGALTIDRSDDVQTTVLLAAVGLVGGELVERARRSHAHTLDRDREIERFQRRAELAAAGEPPGRLVARSAEELADLLDAVDVEYRVGSPPSEVSVLTHDGARRAKWPRARLAPTSPRYRFGLMAATLGYFLLLFPRSNAGMSIDIDRRHAAAAVADQLGVALLRHRRS